MDRLALIFGYIFHIAAFLSGLYALKVEDSIQHLSGMVYAGAAIAGICRRSDILCLRESEPFHLYFDLGLSERRFFAMWGSVSHHSSGVWCDLLAGALLHFKRRVPSSSQILPDGDLSTATTVILLLRDESGVSILAITGCKMRTPKPRILVRCSFRPLHNEVGNLCIGAWICRIFILDSDWLCHDSFPNLFCSN